MPRFDVVAVAWVTLVGCGGNNICQKYADEFEACDEGGDAFDIEDCEAQLEPCDNQDLDLIDDFYECASDEGLFECDAEVSATNMTEAFEMMGAIFACAEPLEDLSEECEGSMMTGSTNASFF
jgi:hypothetical protein